jgi:hypothetical protein
VRRSGPSDACSVYSLSFGVYPSSFKLYASCLTIIQRRDRECCGTRRWGERARRPTSRPTHTWRIRQPSSILHQELRRRVRASWQSPLHAIRLPADRRKSDLLNERLPEFDPTGAENEVHAPSMRPGLSRSWTDLSTEQLIRQTLQEDPMAEQDDAVLGRRPAGFNRHGTT